MFKRRNCCAGVDYQLHEFLGNDVDAEKVLKRKDTALKYVSIYLAPGDYHAFHSPADWRIDARRHIHGGQMFMSRHEINCSCLGEMLSVKFRLLDKVSKLFTLNERVALMGQWKYGFMSMTAVAATNVGNIHIDSASDRGVQRTFLSFTGSVCYKCAWCKAWQLRGLGVWYTSKLSNCPFSRVNALNADWHNEAEGTW